MSDSFPEPLGADSALLVIAHRGASGYRPEHTLASYRLAIELGADVIEPDLVVTKDHVLVARHENEISATTDVARHPEFAGRRTTKVIDDRPVTGWFTEDFTLAELKTLRAVERLPELRPANVGLNGRFEVPTLGEVIALAKAESRRLGRPVAIYPETKHPSYFRAIGLPLEEPLVATLRGAGWAGRHSPVYIQSFEVGNLRRLRRVIDVPLVQLLDSSGAPYDLRTTGDPRTYADLATPSGLDEVAGYADGIGPEAGLVIPRAAGGQLGAPTSLVTDAHAAGLVVHAWTFRRENAFLPTECRWGEDPAGVGDLAGLVRRFRQIGVDGVFTDNSDIAVAVREAERRAA